MVALGSPSQHASRRGGRSTALLQRPVALLLRTEIGQAIGLFGLLVVLTFLAAGWTAAR